jgi:TolB-like protein/DNA-binding winged helix-turn-helix (wHTH) protein/Tfp pilus assembly protein PilF
VNRTGQRAGVLRFGTFELGLASGELRKGGVLIKLQALPFQLLALLAGRAGEVVSREEIRRALWHDGTFVDFDRSINFCVNQIREALGDDSQNPRFIETLPRKGYRFIASLTEGGESSKAEVAPEPSVVSKPVRPDGVNREAGSQTARPVLVRAATKAPAFSRKNLLWFTAVLASLALVLAVSWYYRHAREKRGAIHSIAVLPFANASGDPNAEYLSEGIAETLIDSLSQLPNLKVMSRDSAFQYRGKGTDAHTVGQALRVEAVFKGRVVRQGDMLTISAELIDARDNSHLWGQQYTRNSSDIFALQKEIAKEMTSALRVRLTGEEEKRLNKAYTANPEAYEDYLKGRYWWNKQTEEGFRKGIEYFEQAIARDPEYSLAYAGLADCYISLASFGLVSAKEGYLKGREWAEKALKLDDTLASAHISLASVKTDYEWDWAEGEKEALRAIELNPNDAEAHGARAEVLWTTGRLDESIKETMQALELDPLSINHNIALAFELFLARRYEQAIEQAARTLELDPQYGSAYYVRGVSYVKKSMYREAMAEFEKEISLFPNEPEALTGLGYGYGVTGKRAGAEKVLAELNRLSRQEFISPVWMAKIYSGLGAKDEAFGALERAYEDRSIVSVAYLKTNPMLDPLRSDPRFAELLRRTNLQ